MQQQELTSTAVVTDFELGLHLSRNYKQRTTEETQQLYELIQWAVIEAQDTTSIHHDNSIEFVVSVFEPLIKKVASGIYPQVSKHEEFEDTVQETYLAFLKLLYAYNPLVSSFPYYISKMLPQQVKAWGQKLTKNVAAPVDISTLDNFLVDPILADPQKTSSQYESYILLQEYEDFILLRAQKKAKSDTVKYVCYYYFLGKKTCSEIATELGISYHAVYEVIKRIERELKEFLSTQIFFDNSGGLL